MTEMEELLAHLQANGFTLDPPFTYIYFIQAEHGGPIKIGKADDPVKRRAQLQCGNPYPLCIRRAVIDHPMEEWRLHKVFHELRLEGEWFQPHPSLAAIADAIPDQTLAGTPIIYRDDLPLGHREFKFERGRYQMQEWLDSLSEHDRWWYDRKDRIHREVQEELQREAEGREARSAADGVNSRAELATAPARISQGAAQ